MGNDKEQSLLDVSPGKEFLECRSTLSDADRMAVLRDYSFDEAYTAVFEFGLSIVSGGAIFKQILDSESSLAGMLLGLEFEDGHVVGFSAFPLKMDIKIMEVIDFLMERYAMVAHVFEVVSDSTPPGVKTNMLIIGLHTKDMVGFSKSKIDPDKKEVIKGQMTFAMRTKEEKPVLN